MAEVIPIEFAHGQPHIALQEAEEVREGKRHQRGIIDLYSCKTPKASSKSNPGAVLQSGSSLFAEVGLASLLNSFPQMLKMSLFDT